MCRLETVNNQGLLYHKLLLRSINFSPQDSYSVIQPPKLCFVFGIERRPNSFVNLVVALVVAHI